MSVPQTISATGDFSAEFESVRGLRIRSILVCLDRSALSEACLPFARFLADALGAEISLLHVIPLASDSSEPSCADPIAWRLSVREAENYLDEIRHELDDSPAGNERVAIELTHGRPAERIVRTAHERGTDLIVLATHGEGGLGPTNLGSTVQQVLALTPCSVLVIPSDSTSPANLPPKRIVVPLDGSLRTESVLPIVTRLAKESAAVVSLVHVVAEPTESAVLVAGDDLALARVLASRIVSTAERYLLRIRADLTRTLRDVEVHVLREVDERRALLDAAESQSADLIVLAAHGCTCDADRTLGSVTSYALTHTRVPVLVLQDLPNARASREDESRTSSSPPPFYERLEHGSRID